MKIKHLPHITWKLLFAPGYSAVMEHLKQIKRMVAACPEESAEIDIIIAAGYLCDERMFILCYLKELARSYKKFKVSATLALSGQDLSFLSV